MMKRWKVIHNAGEEPMEYETCATEIHRAAEEIAEEMDCRQAHYPDDRLFFIWCPRRERWLEMSVQAEVSRTYEARHFGESENPPPSGERKEER